MAASVNMFEDAPDDPVEYARPYPRDCNTDRLIRTTFHKGSVYILDDGSTRGHMDDDEVDDIHPQKCRIIRNLFEKFSTYDVKAVPAMNTEKSFIRYWTNQLCQKSDNEITVIYFHGTFGGNGTKLAFAMESSPHRVDAWKLLELFSKSDKNVLLLIDGFFPERLDGKNALYREMTCRAGFELLASGYPGQNTEGTPCANQFTSSIAKKLRKYVELAKKDKLKLNAPFSFSGLLRSVTALNTNPDRVWFTKTKKVHVTNGSGEKVEKPKVVPRFRIDPDYIREHGKFIIHSDIIKDTEKEARDRAAENQKAQEEGERVARESLAHNGDEGFIDDDDEDEAADDIEEWCA